MVFKKFCNSFICISFVYVRWNKLVFSIFFLNLFSIILFTQSVFFVFIVGGGGQYVAGTGESGMHLPSARICFVWNHANMHSFFPKSNIPSWLNLSVGTGIENTFGARSNVATTQTGNLPFDRSDLPRYRQWYLAPDIDFTRIPTKHKAVRALLFVLNSVKFPTPTIEFSQNKFHWHWFYF